MPCGGAILGPGRANARPTDRTGGAEKAVLARRGTAPGRPALRPGRRATRCGPVSARARGGTGRIVPVGAGLAAGGRGKGGRTVVVYADLLWLIDFLSDALALWLAAYALRRRISLGRFLVGGLLLSGAVFFLFVPLPPFLALFVRGAFAAAAVGLVFRPPSAGAFFRALAALIGAYAAVAGFALMLDALAAPVGPGAVTPEGLIRPLPALSTLAAGFGVAAVLGRLHFQPLDVSGETLVRLTLTEGGRSVTLSALIDTGNHLADPLSGEPVGLVALASVRPLFADDGGPARPGAGNDDRRGDEVSVGPSPEAVLSALPEALRRRARLIPYRAVGAAGLLVAVRFAAAAVEGRRGRRALQAPLFALVPEALDPDGVYAAVLPPAWRPAASSPERRAHETADVSR
ncbi:sigma-E processing peptidase SpoIIGA [Hydrogenibacillus schlegelii]|uniref:sigma-E processing peptidase SpoIIGA n=1 Tax=Hydrogenibacillus schlegelii TaxID=1484 RepID=UPI0009E6ABEB|nr:sigma-E processing peptidase SpoIIGA [Hydrogenibacillus schlegelii]